jgi:hypothetical protein
MAILDQSDVLQLSSAINTSSNVVPTLYQITFQSDVLKLSSAINTSSDVVPTLYQITFQSDVLGFVSTTPKRTHWWF